MVALQTECLANSVLEEFVSLHTKMMSFVRDSGNVFEAEEAEVGSVSTTYTKIEFHRN